MLRIPGFPFSSIRQALRLRDVIVKGFICTISCLAAGSTLYSTILIADDVRTTTSSEKEEQSLEQLKRDGKARSRFLEASRPEQDATATKPDQKQPEPKLAEFRTQIEPILRSACMDCHGPDTQEGNIRIDSLDPNLHVGKDVDWWTEISQSSARAKCLSRQQIANRSRARSNCRLVV